MELRVAQPLLQILSDVQGVLLDPSGPPGRLSAQVLSMISAPAYRAHFYTPQSDAQAFAADLEAAQWIDIVRTQAGASRNPSYKGAPESRRAQRAQGTRTTMSTRIRHAHASMLDMTRHATSAF